MNIFRSGFDRAGQSSRIIAASLLFLLLWGMPLLSQQSPPPSSPLPPAPAPKASPSAWKQQKATMAAIKAIAVAWETYFNDFSSYCPRKVDKPELNWGNIDPKEMSALLAPTYIQNLPLQDGWDGRLQFAVQCTAKGAQAYSIRSAGSDGQWDGDHYKPGTKTLRPTQDIVFSNGQFVQWPEGMAK